jgi:D-erythro-7,8-dihydroneopterin triphosphate epimerase
MTQARSNYDRISIRDLKISCIIGLNEEERVKKQDVLINLALYADLSKACHSDRIEDSVDYKAIKRQIIDFVEVSSYLLIEKLAEKIADLCLKHPLIMHVDVTVDKPGALRFARSVGVEISRSKKG